MSYVDYDNILCLNSLHVKVIRYSVLKGRAKGFQTVIQLYQVSPSTLVVSGGQGHYSFPNKICNSTVLQTGNIWVFLFQ